MRAARASKMVATIEPGAILEDASEAGRRAIMPAGTAEVAHGKALAALPWRSLRM